MHNFSDLERDFGADEFIMHLENWAQRLPARSTLIEAYRDTTVGGWHILLRPHKAGTAGIHISVVERRGFSNEPTYRKDTVYLWFLSVFGRHYNILSHGRHKFQTITDILTPISEGKTEEHLWSFHREFHIPIRGVNKVYGSFGVIPLAKLYYKARGIPPRDVRQFTPWVASNPEVEYRRSAPYRGNEWIKVASLSI